MYTKFKKIWLFYGLSTNPKLVPNERKLSPVARNLKINASPCFKNIAFLITGLFWKQ